MMNVGTPATTRVSRGYRSAIWKITMTPPIITAPIDITKPLNHTSPLLFEGEEKISEDDPTKKQIPERRNACAFN
jgi:hypothetical protein